MGKYNYKTEREARQAYVLECLKWCGIKEGSQDHAELISYYNMIAPLPRGYRMSLKDAWCAAFLSAVAWKLGYRNWFFECSCPKLVEQAKKDGAWKARGYIPQAGDWIVYDLNKNGTADHVGIVTGVEGKRVFACEGNFSDSVKNRFDAELDDEIITGFIVHNFYELVDNSNMVGGDRPNIPIEVPEIKEDNTVEQYKSVSDMPEWAREGVQELVDIGVIEGVGDGDLGMGLTETRLAVWIWRLGKWICKKLSMSLK